MSLAEMKAVAIEKIKATDDQKILEDVLHTLSSNGNDGKEANWDVEKFFNEAVAQYGDTLRRLAQ